MKLKKIKQFFIWTIHINIIFLFLENLTLIRGNNSLVLRDNSSYIYQGNGKGPKIHYWKCRFTNCKGYGKTDRFELIKDEQGNICEYDEVNVKNEDGSFERTKNINFELITNHDHERNII